LGGEHKGDAPRAGGINDRFDARAVGSQPGIKVGQCFLDFRRDPPVPADLIFPTADALLLFRRRRRLAPGVVELDQVGAAPPWAIYFRACGSIARGARLEASVIHTIHFTREIAPEIINARLHDDGGGVLQQG